MSKPTEALRRLGVAGLATATMGVGLTAFTASPALAATSGIKAVSITPTNTATSTGAVFTDNTATGANAGCQLYTIKATDGNGTNVSGTINVILKPTSGVDSEFCSDSTGTETVISNGGGAGADVGNPGAPDQATFAETGAFVIGVTEEEGTSTALTATGSIAITAYADNVTANNQVDTNEPKGTATDNLVASPTNSADKGQNEITDTLQSSPASTTGTAGVGTEDFTVTTLHGTALVAGADVDYQVTSSQGNVIDHGTCSFTLNGDASGGAADGTTTCTVDNPATLTSGVGSPQSGPYTVTFFTPHPSCDAGSTAFVAGCDASTTSTLNEVEPAPANSAVFLDCATNPYAPWWCEESGQARSETLTARVLMPASSSSTTPSVPASGVQVEFILNHNGGNGDDPTIDPTTCVTDTNGVCTAKFTRAANDTGVNSSETTLYAEIQTTGGAADSTDGNAYGEFTFLDFGWEGPYESPATNIAGGPASSGQTGQTKVVSFNISNQYGVPANETCFTDDFDLSNAPGDSCNNNSLASPNSVSSTTIPVTLSISGAGTFSDGTNTKTVTASNGVAQVAVTSNSAGTSTVSANLDPSTTDCNVPAPASSNGFENDYFEFDPLAEAKAGNCSATSTVTWSKPTTTTHRVVVSLHLTCFSPKRHVVKCVAQLSRPISGVTVVFRNSHGTVVGRDVTNSSGKAVMKLRGLKSHRTHRYHAHAKRSARTFAADSNVAKVRVS